MLVRRHSHTRPRAHTYAARLAGVPDTDQELACLHVDILAALYRVELAVGVAEQQAQALQEQVLLMENVKRRCVDGEGRLEPRAQVLQGQVPINAH